MRWLRGVDFTRTIRWPHARRATRLRLRFIGETPSGSAMATEAQGAGSFAGAPKYFVYPFFLVHMLMFGVAGFVLAYGADGDVGFLYMHGGLAIVVYTVFYLAIFGFDEVLWMFINAGLGVAGIHTQLGWILGMFFGRNLADFPWYVHAIPMLYFVLYTFLLRQLVLDLTRSRDNPKRRRLVEAAYIVLTLALYAATWLLHL